MTNSQLYLSIGLPTLLILIGLLLNWSATKELGTRFNTLQATVSNIEARITGHDQRFATIDTRFDLVDARFEAVNERLGSVDRRLGAIEADLREFYRAIGKVEGRLDALENK